METKIHKPPYLRSLPHRIQRACCGLCERTEPAYLCLFTQLQSALLLRALLWGATEAVAAQSRFAAGPAFMF